MSERVYQIKTLLQESHAARIFSHLVFWLLVALFYFVLFSWNSESREVSIIFSAGLIPVAIGVSYFFNYILVPKYLWQKKYVRFFLFSFYALLVSTWFSFLIVFFTLLYILTQKSYIAPSALHPEWQVITLNFVVFLAIAVKQIKRSFYIQQEKNKLEKTKLTTELKLKEAELKLLKAQIHPHFLFNTLNNLYGLTLEKSEEAPQLVLRLSEILDYILYRCNDKRVLLSEEIKILKNYIEIERVRYSKKLELNVTFPENTKGLQVAPLLILPFIENAFKHGASHASGNAFVKIDVALHEKALLAAITNKKNTPQKNSTATKGIGLKNVQKRLELMYPGKHILKIEEDDKSYSVNLTLQLDE